MSKKILHYFLGFPPYRSGGMTIFATDLMKEQAKRGDKVFALWPGRIKSFTEDIDIVKSKREDEIFSCELINPLPISYDEGIKNPDWFMEKCTNPECFKRFIEENGIEVVHIHTIMGLYKEFVDILKEEKVKTIFTTHDYYPICQQVYLVHNGVDCSDSHDIEECARIGAKNGLSKKKMFLMQSGTYRKIKNNAVVAMLRKKHRAKYAPGSVEPAIGSSKIDVKSYEQLEKYYKDIIENIDVIHFTSSVAKEVYKKYFKIKKGEELSISHSGITDNRNLEKTDSNKIRFVFLSDRKKIKGFSVLLNALDRLYNEGQRDFVLNIYGEKIGKPYVNWLGERYHHGDMREIFKESDILIAPSLWHETFGFIVEEALSYGTPAVISDTMGVRDIVGKAGLIISVENLYDSLKKLDEKKANSLHANARQNILVPYWGSFVEKVNKIYKD